jgi:hypothetical protein
VNELVLFTGNTLPHLITDAGDQARMRFLEFFTANIRNPNTRRAYAKGCEEFLAWCSFAGVPSIAAVQPVHVATYIERSLRASGPRPRSRRAWPRSVIFSTGSSSARSCASIRPPAYAVRVMW